MARQTVQIELPEEVLQRLKGMATQTQQPLEHVIAQSIRGNLPPILDDLPPEQRNLVVDLQALSDEELWTIARESRPSRRWRRHQRLLQRAETGALANAARAELTELREATDRFVTRRSYALALLKWRGYAVPSTP